jgi:hypothetical protein
MIPVSLGAKTLPGASDHRTNAPSTDAGASIEAHAVPFQWTIDIDALVVEIHTSLDPVPVNA